MKQVGALVNTGFARKINGPTILYNLLHFSLICVEYEQKKSNERKIQTPHTKTIRSET